MNYRALGESVLRVEFFFFGVSVCFIALLYVDLFFFH